MNEVIATAPAASNTVSYDTSAVIVLTQKSERCMRRADSNKIDSDFLLDVAGDELKDVMALKKNLEEQRTSITGPLNAALKSVNDLFRKPREFLEQAESTLKNEISRYTTEQRRIAEEARAKAEAAARAERERLAKEQAEQEAQARKAQQETQAAAAAGDKEAARVAAEQAEAAIAKAQAAELTAAVTTVAPAVMAPAKVAGISQRMTYSAQVNNLMELVKAVAEGKAPIEALQADAKFLGAQARAFKKAGALYPGVEVIASATVSARAA